MAVSAGSFIRSSRETVMGRSLIRGDGLAPVQVNGMSWGRVAGGFRAAQPVSEITIKIRTIPLILGKLFVYKVIALPCCLRLMGVFLFWGNIIKVGQGFLRETCYLLL